MNFVRDALDAKKMIEMERQAMHVAHELQNILNKSKLPAPVACLAIHEVYHRTKTFFPELMAVIEKNAIIPDSQKSENK